MMGFLKRLSKQLVIVSTIALLPMTAQATLQERDLDKNGIVDAFYDTTLNVTWLRNANLVNHDSWYVAANFAENYVIGIYDDWRLPACTSAYCETNEMGHLWNELGNPNTLTSEFKTGGFQNLLRGTYWTSTDWPNDPTTARTFMMDVGYTSAYSKSGAGFAMAVRDGDVAAAPVPELETYAMLLAGLGLMGAVARRRKQK